MLMLNQRGGLEVVQVEVEVVVLLVLHALRK